MAARKKAVFRHVEAPRLPLNVISDRFSAIEKAWLELENAAIEVAEDIGLKSFGGEKIKTLMAAVMKLRRERVLDDARELYRIIKTKDRSAEARGFMATIEAMVKRIPKEA